MHVRDNERKGHKESGRGTEGVNKAGGEQGGRKKERKKERAMEGCC